MSDAPGQASSHEEHTGPIKTPKQLIVTVVASFVIPIAVIILLVNYVAFGDKPAAGSDGLGAEAVALRIQPVGRVVIRDASDIGSLKTGDQVYAAVCGACHTGGVAGAPKTGDTGAWASRLATGYEALLNSALKGKGAMGAQGGGDFTDYEIGRAVVYMANKSGGSLPEPTPPAAPAAN
jgi:cytochrome c5